MADPFASVPWAKRHAILVDDEGTVVFDLDDVEAPASWSETAVNVVASRYFKPGPAGERSVKDLLLRVGGTLSRWVKEEGLGEPGYEAALLDLLLHQRGAFNSPVWFNVGVDGHPQCSACFILSVKDDLNAILELARVEAVIFKYGSGCGTNLSVLRSSRERLSGGGFASGPVSFMRGYDAFAGVVKSGGRTRRAAKMQILDVAHPDIRDFVHAKAVEERKAKALAAAGFGGGLDGEAHRSVAFQNSNLSVRVTDDFLRAVREDKPWTTRAVRDGAPVETFPARALLREIAQGAWECGDPGLQYDAAIQTWHTCPESGRIHASNPCVTGDTLVATSRGWRRIDSLLNTLAEVIGADGKSHWIKPAFATGVKPVYLLRTKSGFELKLTADHRVLTHNRRDVPACELTHDDVLVLGRPAFGRDRIDEKMAEVLGLLVGDGCIAGQQGKAILTLAPEEELVATRAHATLVRYRRENAADRRASRSLRITRRQGTLRIATASRCVVELARRYAILDEGSIGKRFKDDVFRLDRPSITALLRGLFTADGTVANYGEKSQYISLDCISLDLLRQVQLLLLSFGIKAKLYRDRRVAGAATALLPDGRGGQKEYRVSQVHSLRVSRSSRVLFERSIGFVAGSPKADRLATLNREVSTYADRLEDRIESLEYVGMEPVYDLTEPETNHFVAGGLVVHNCSEFLFLDDTACNLASLNLLSYLRGDATFDTAGFRRDAATLFRAMEAIVDRSVYPTPRIADMSRIFRPLGLGYANLGALLMALGLPYDSAEGRGWAAAITALMTGEAYRVSAAIAAKRGPFEAYEPNREDMLRVLEMHRGALGQVEAAPEPLLAEARRVWDETLRLAHAHGLRNAQATALAPTGTIAFLMDCDTTGIEPDLSLVKYKALSGGGSLKLTNRVIPRALARLGYAQGEIEAILKHLEREEGMEGAPHMRREHLPVFDCAFRPGRDGRTISTDGHLLMMAAVQPFLSGGISKTVNLPRETTVEEIERIYLRGGELGLKALAVYREGSKGIEPLTTRCMIHEGRDTCCGG